MQQVGRYRLTRRLGQGGMAEVFEAVAEGEAGFRRRVALKRVLPELAGDASIARMFLDEARTTSHLHHASIVSVLDYGTAEGAAFQVLEYVDGLDLDRLLRRADERHTPLPLGLALHISLQVAQALDYAHNARDELGQSLGIVHRDVSPSNVLVGWDGHLKLSDFGIALAANRLERTEGAGVKGKLEYMSPEQATRGHVDRRSDVFALGCMLQRLITGKSPLGELSALTRMASGEEIVLDDSLPAPIREVIARATRNAQTQRYASAAELARALALLLPSYLTDEPIFAVQRWLSGLRDDVVALKKRSALDALLDVELVLSPPSDSTEQRSFAYRTPVARAAPQAPLEPAQPSSRPRLWRVGLTLALGALLATGLYLARDPRSAPSAPPPALPTLSAIQAAPASPQIVNEPDDLAPPSPVPVAQPAPTKRARKSRARSEPASAPHAEPAPVPSSAPAGLGTLVIGGDGALRAEIRVDGRSLGFAPRRIELSAGPHELVLVRPDGTRIGPRNLRIETHHTQSAPARWIVD